MPTTLPVSRLVKVSVNLTPSGAQSQNLSTLMIFGTSAVIDVVERYRTYSSITAVASDFGTTAPEYLAALLWFQQVPQPTQLKIGRWASAATSGVLRGGTLSAAQQLLSVFTAVTSGGFTFTRNGGTATNVTGINLSGAANLSAVAALITAAAGVTGLATMVWNSTFSRFELTSSTTGATSSISFLTAPGTGTDISGMLGMLASSGGAYQAVGVVAETALACVQFFDLNYGQTWYAALVIGATTADHLAVAGFLEATSNKHVYGVTTQDAGSLVSATTTDVAYLLSQLAYNKTFVQYSSSNPYAVASLLARILTVDYTGNQTVITLAFKGEPGIVAENINTTQADSLKAKKCNAFLAFENSTAIILTGAASSGVFIDIVIGTDWLATTLQAQMYNVLYTSVTKVPQTDAGVNLLVVACEAVCSQAVTNGLLAPGLWLSAGFGALAQNDFMPKGFYVYAPSVNSQNSTDRAARKSPPIQIAAKLAGAIHEISIAVVVNQ